MSLNIPILNALWRITTGEKFDYDDKKLKSIIEKVEIMFSSLEAQVRGALYLRVHYSIYFFLFPGTVFTLAMVKVCHAQLDWTH